MPGGCLLRWIPGHRATRLRPARRREVATPSAKPLNRRSESDSRGEKVFDEPGDVPERTKCSSRSLAMVLLRPWFKVDKGLSPAKGAGVRRARDGYLCECSRKEEVEDAKRGLALQPDAPPVPRASSPERRLSSKSAKPCFGPCNKWVHGFTVDRGRYSRFCSIIVQNVYKPDKNIGNFKFTFRGDAGHCLLCARHFVSRARRTT